jgi:transposase
MIKVSVVASDIFGVSGRDMLSKLVAGERDPKALAQLARGSMRGKIGRLEEAFTGRFTDHHAFLLRTMLARIDAITADIDRVQARIDEQIIPFAKAVTRLDEIPGVGLTAAHTIIAEIGLDMTRFPTPGHLVSWARYAPGVSESAGRKKGGSWTGHGNRYLARILGEAAIGARKTKTFLGERYRRIAKRRGKKRAIVAIGRSILVIIWHLLSDEEKRFVDLGPDYFDSHINHNRSTRNHVRELQALGYNVILEPAA